GDKHYISSLAVRMSLRMRTPGGGVEELHFLRHHQRAEFGGEAFGEVGVGEDRIPMRTAAGIVVELPEMDDLVDRSRIALEVAHEVLVVTAFLQGRKAELL